MKVNTGTGIVDISEYFKENWNLPTEKCNHEVDSACIFCNPQMFEIQPEISMAISTHIMSERLYEAKNRYYGTGNSTMTDAEYDALESNLRAINPNAPVLNQVGSK